VSLAITVVFVALAAVTTAASQARVLGPSRSVIAPRPPSGRSASPSSDAPWAIVLDAIAAHVRSGHSVRDAYTTAMRSTAASGRALSSGTSLAEVSKLTSTDPDETVALQTLVVAMTLGGPVAAVLQSGAMLLRERATIRADAIAHAAQARLSARVLTAVPLLFAGGSTLTSRSFRSAIASGPGAVAIAIGLLTNVVGWWWMRRIVDKAAT
jgi:Flp pilus assembly protein TadB